jgi:hypothetical protein
MDIQKIKLKSCPFCGGIATFKDMRADRYYISCDNSKCRAQVGETWGDLDTPERLAERWNLRDRQIERLQARVEELELEIDFLTT